MNINAEELMRDEALMAELSTADTPELVRTAFAKKGIDLTVEEAQKVLDNVDEANDELTEEALTNVSGGSLIVGLCVLAFVIGVARSANQPCKETKSTKKKR